MGRPRPGCEHEGAFKQDPHSRVPLSLHSDLATPQIVETDKGDGPADGRKLISKAD